MFDSAAVGKIERHYRYDQRCARGQVQQADKQHAADFVRDAARKLLASCTATIMESLPCLLTVPFVGPLGMQRPAVIHEVQLWP